MELTHAANESTPLLGNDVASNRHRPLFRICANSIEQTSLNLIDTTSNGQTLVDLNATTSDGQTPILEQGASSSSGKKEQIITCPITIEWQSNEVSLEEVAQALFSAWQRNRRETRTSHDYVTLHHLTTKELYAMSLAWRNVTRGRDCPHTVYEIAEAVAAAIAAVISPPSEILDEDFNVLYRNLDYGIVKSFLTANLLREWERITEGRRFPVRYTETIFEDSDEQPLAVSERCLRQVELYDRVHDFVYSPKLQILLHSFLIFWPISLLAIGTKYVECTMSHHLSYLLITLGILGCSAILVRLALMYFDSQPQYMDNSFWWGWLYQKLIEFTFLIVFIVQAFHFFITDPTTEPDPDHCVKNFYNTALVINCLSTTLVSSYVLIYFIIICENYLDLWNWIFRYLS